MVRLVVFFLFCIVYLPAIAQDFSNKGKDFFIAYPAHLDGVNSVMGIYITSDVNASGTIKVGAATVPFTVTANQVARKFLGSGAGVDASNADVYLNMQDGVKAGAAIRILSDKPVVVYTHIIHAAKSGATLALPANVLGTEYIAPSHFNTGGSPSYGEVAVVATQPGTLIEMTPTVAGRAGKPASVPFQVSLPNVGDVYQFQGIADADISGTRIRSISAGGTGGCKPIAVFSATTWSAFDCPGASGGDNLYQQLFPLKSWGKRFITAPFINRENDIYKIFVSDPSTIVTVQKLGVPYPLYANDYNANGKFYTIKTGDPLYIEADKPVSVVQYITSQICKTGCSSFNAFERECLADPEMVLLSPIEQTLSEVTFFSAHQAYVPAGQTQVTEHFVNVVINKNYKGSVEIDNALVPAINFVDIPNSDYAYLQQDLTASSAVNPVHRITADTSFSALVYGYGMVESYGYNGGTNVRDLYQYVTIQNQYASVNFPATCKNAPFFFSITLPYQATSLTWDFGSNPNLSPNNEVVNNAPVPDSSFVKDGRTLYVYKLPAVYTFSAIGTYPVKVFANNPSPDGCPGIQEINYDVEVYPPPTVDFTVTHSGCAADSVHFKDISFGNGRQVTQWNWSFGNTETASSQSPSVLFSSAGTYNVTLRSITDIGCLADTTKPVLINATPVAKFGTPAILCSEKAVIFSDTSTMASGAIEKWYWNFGNGDSITYTSNIAPTQTYPAPGLYKVRLQVESSAGCKSNIFQKDLILNPLPLVNFLLPVVCLNDAFAQFNDSSTISDGSEALFSYLWNFDDPNATQVTPNTSTNKNAQHKYSTTGVYDVNLTVTSNKGCAASVVKPFTVNGAVPDAQFEILGATGLCSGSPVRFQNKSIVDFGTITSLHIIWDNVNAPATIEIDPAPAFNKVYVHDYPASPLNTVYQVKVRTFSGGTCVDELIKSITIYPAPKVSFDSIKGICFGAMPRLVNVPANNGIPGLGVFSGKGISPEGLFNPSVAGIGKHTISYTYTTGNGCKDSTTAQITVWPDPVVNAGPDQFILEGDDLVLRPQVVGNDLIYLWDPFLYLNNDTIKNPVSRPQADITYKITVTSPEGCKTSDEIFIKLLKALVIPNVFSPNGDGINDVWNIGHLENYPGATVEVFDRYGQQVFMSYGYKKPWDGTFNGKRLAVGTYYYIINPKNGRTKYSGAVTILQ